MGKKVTVANVEYTRNDLQKMTDEELRAYSELVNKKYSATDPNIVATMKNAGYTNFNKFAAALLGAVNSGRKGTVFEQILTDNAAEDKKNPGVEYGTVQKVAADVVNHTAAPLIAAGVAAGKTVKKGVEFAKDLAPTFVEVATQNAPSTGAAGTSVHASKISEKGVLPTPYDGKNGSDTNEASLGNNVSGPLPKKPEKTLQKGASGNANGGGSGEDVDNKGVRKSNRHSLWGNTDEVITDEIAREYYNRSKPIVQDYMSDPKYQADPELAAQQAAIAANNVIKGTPGTNMNNKTANQTLRLSRLTDALNNRVWTAPVTGGYATETYGTADMSNPTGYKREATETADTRQQQRLEQYEAAARDLDFNILKLQQQYNLMKAQGADTAQLNLWYQTAYQGLMQQFGQNMYHWQQQTDLKYNVQKAWTIRNLNHRNPEAASYLTAILGAGVVNNIIDADYNQAMADIMNDPSLTWQKKMAAVQLLTADMVQAPMSQITGALEGIIPGIKEVAKTASPFGGNKDASN